jgi:RNA polymerase sigma-70 factor (ECF subfamily)
VTADEFEELYRTHRARVLAFCLRRAERDRAEDAVSETFAIAWRRRDAIPREALPWLFGIARRVLANQRRAAGRQQAVADRLASVPAPAFVPAGEHAVLDALARLPGQDQEALMLAAWEGLRAADAARVLGCTAVAFRLRLLRARRKLARALAEAEPNEPRLNSTELKTEA